MQKVSLLQMWVSGFIVGLIVASCSSANGQVMMRERIMLTPTNTVVFRGPVTEDSVLKGQIAIHEAELARPSILVPIYLVLDSPGGDVDAGLSFIEYVKTVPNLHTISIFSASMASAIVEALPGERLITNNGYLMFHRARGGFQGQFEEGEVERRLYMAKQIIRRMENMNAARMKMKLDDYKALVKDELWLDSEQSMTYRAADKIVDIQCTPELIQDTDIITVQVFIFQATFTFSKCPLMRSPTSGTMGKYRYQAPTLSNYDSIRKALRIDGSK